MAASDFQYTLHKDEFMYKDVLYDDFTTVDVIQACEEFEFRSDDIVIFTFPRTGTTLTQEIMWQVLNHEIVEEGVQYESLELRYGFIELNPKYQKQKEFSNVVEVLKSKKPTERRLIKSHLPYSIFREQIEKVNPKVVIVFRNPKDTAIALYHFLRGLRGDTWTPTLSEFLPCFLHGKTISGDFFSNCLDWWSLRDRPNVLILNYEDILANKHQQVRTLAGFFGVEVPPEKVEAIVHNTSFGTMSKNENINVHLDKEKKHTFLRKGKSGGWQNVLTVAENAAFDRVIEERLRGTGLSFHYS